MNFRADINGLRSIAVLSVVLFHFNVYPFSGGFIGVDVFFVISGFLMTSIVMGRIDKGTFSFVQFCLDRAKRILPALIFLCVSLLIIGWFVLTPYSYQTLGKHAASSLAFLSNFIFWKEAGYFDTASHEKWLLHTWSLSVEWQFYILLPVLLTIVKRWIPTKDVRATILVIALASFITSAILTPRFPSASFFFLPTRAWELLAGALVYFYPRSLNLRTGRAFEYIGLTAITSSVFIFDSGNVWPGANAALPVIGSMLVLYANRTDSPITTNLLMQFIGRISYSVYLWHWPIVVALNYFDLLHDARYVILGCGTSVLLGWLSYRYIENIFRGKVASTSLLRVSTPILAPTFTVACLASSVYILHGLPVRTTAEFVTATQEGTMPMRDNGWCFYSVDSLQNLKVGEDGLTCSVGEPGGSVNALLFGDSYAGHSEPFWDMIGKKNATSIKAISTNWCYSSVAERFPPEISARAQQQCVINRTYLREHFKEYDFIVFASSWGTLVDNGQLADVLSTASKISKSVPVILMAAPTYFDVDVRTRFERDLFLGRSFNIDSFSRTRDASVAAANATLQAFAAKTANVTFLDRDTLFSANGKRSDATSDNVPYSFDGNHLSIYGSKKSATSFEKSSQYSQFQRQLSRLRSGQRLSERVD